MDYREQLVAILGWLEKELAINPTTEKDFNRLEIVTELSNYILTLSK